MHHPLYALYDTEHLAEQAMARLVAAGVKRRAIRTLMLPAGEQMAHMGSFADSGAHTHDAERDHMGGFADTGEHMHDAERDRVGSFAGTPAEQHTGSFASHLHADDIVRELIAAGLGQADAQAIVAHMAGGATLLLVQPADELRAQVMMIMDAA